VGLIRDDVDIQQRLAISAVFNGLMIGKILGIDQKLIEQTWMGAPNIMYSSPLQVPAVRSPSILAKRLDR
jgi:hypothetical protein